MCKRGLLFVPFSGILLSTALLTGCGQDHSGSSRPRRAALADEVIGPLGTSDDESDAGFDDVEPCDETAESCAPSPPPDDASEDENEENDADVAGDAAEVIDGQDEADDASVPLAVEEGGELDVDADADEIAPSPDDAGALDEANDCLVDGGEWAFGVCLSGAPDAANDGDGEEASESVDTCPLDPNKTDPGTCGCGVVDLDGDFDGVADCVDACPLDPNKVAGGDCGCGLSDVDSDGDLTPDCRDVCPTSASKVDPERCGCDRADVDSDGDGVVDCRDACPADPTRWRESECREGPAPVGPAYVDITWMSISNVYYQLGPLNIVTDGYISRIPMSNFYGGLGGLAYTRVATKPDVAAVGQVLAALGGAGQVNLLLTGHSHFDHALDTGTWASLSGASVLGSKTTCFQVRAQGIPAGRCTAVNGGERITLADGVTMRVVRWNHSGDAVSNPEQHNPIELSSIPLLDPSTGGLHAGVAESFPNGGGGRGYLFTVNGPDGPYSWFFQNSAAAADLQVPIVVDGVDYGAPLDNLQSALADAGLDSVDLWIGAGGASVAQLVLPVLRPKAFLPVHWDNFYSAFLAGTKKYTVDRQLGPVLTAAGVKLISPVQYMDKWRLDRSGITAVPNTEVKQALGFTN